MKKKLLAILLTMALVVVPTACGSQNNETTNQTTEATEVTETVEEEEPEAPAQAEQEEAETDSDEALEDGVYQVDFDTDSSMFHVNEAMNGHGELTVENGEMTCHISLVSKKILNLYLGLAENAPEDQDNWLMPTEDEITYEDGTTEVVYGFDVPVEKLGEEFDLALIGEKGTWYDHKVSVSNPVK